MTDPDLRRMKGDRGYIQGYNAQAVVNEQHMDHLTAEHGIQVLIPPDSGKRDGERPGWTGGRYAFMRRVLAGELGKQPYRKRQQSIEPAYGHTKHNRKIYRFNYRGRRP